MTSIVSSEGASSRTANFTDPESYTRAVRATQADLVVTGKGRFYSELTGIDFQQLWMQRGDESLGRVAWIRNCPSRAPIMFLTEDNPTPMTDGGLEVSAGDIVVYGLGSTSHARTAADTHWGAMSLTPEDLAKAGLAILGRELTVPPVTRRIRPATRLMSRLLASHAEACRLARQAPEILARPEVAHALEQKLLHLMVRCLASGDGEEGSRSNRRHGATVSRLEDLLAANSGRPLHLAEICATIGVSERTLRLCCQEHLGMGPIQYLWLRRMNLAHAALVGAPPGTATVTDVATRFGFWELGRFSVAYRTLFGESPSQTLAKRRIGRRASGELSHPLAETA